MSCWYQDLDGEVDHAISVQGLTDIACHICHMQTVLPPCASEYVSQEKFWSSTFYGIVGKLGRLPNGGRVGCDSAEHPLSGTFCHMNCTETSLYQSGSPNVSSCCFLFGNGCH